MRRARVRRLLLVLALAGAAPARAEDAYSRFCKAPPEGEQELRGGKYEGTFQQRLEATRAVSGSEIRQVYVVQGKLRLTYDPWAGRCQSGAPSSLSGEFETTLEAHMPMLGKAEGRVQRAGSGTLRLEQVCPAQLLATAQGQESGQLTAPGVARSQSGRGTGKVTFKVREASCERVSGDAFVDLLQQAADQLRGAGHTVNDAAGTWTLTRPPDDLAARRKELKDELTRKPSGEGASALVRTPEAEGKRIAKIADRFRWQYPELWDCLYPTWAEYAEQWAAGWVATETGQLAQFAPGGDWPTLSDHLARAISADRALSFLGRDTCSTPLHQQLWAAIEKALDGYLTRMAEGRAPLQNLLPALKQREVIGDVAPGLEDKAWAAIQADARQMADATWQAFTTALTAARSAGRDPGADPKVVATLKAALTAERAAVCVGIELSRAPNAAAELGLSP